MRLGNILRSINKRVLILMGAGALFLSILIAAVMVIRDYREDSSIKAREEVKMAYDMNNLIEAAKNSNRCDFIFPEVIEELDLSADPYRAVNFKWTDEEVSRLWQEADAADIDYFTEANHRLIWEILKDAP